MAELSVVLAVILLAVLILTCVEGDKPRRGKNRSNNRQKDKAENIREEICRVPKAGRPGEASDYYIRHTGTYTLSHAVSVANLKEKLTQHFSPAWFEGPNVCQHETMETFNSNGIGSAGLIRLEDLGTKTCYEYGTMFKCTIVNKVTNGITAYTQIAGGT